MRCGNKIVHNVPKGIVWVKDKNLCDKCYKNLSGECIEGSVTYKIEQ